MRGPWQVKEDVTQSSPWTIWKHWVCKAIKKRFSKDQTCIFSQSLERQEKCLETWASYGLADVCQQLCVPPEVCYCSVLKWETHWSLICFQHQTHRCFQWKGRIAIGNLLKNAFLHGMSNHIPIRTSSAVCGKVYQAIAVIGIALLLRAHQESQPRCFSSEVWPTFEEEFAMTQGSHTFCFCAFASSLK